MIVMIVQYSEADLVVQLDDVLGVARLVPLDEAGVVLDDGGLVVLLLLRGGRDDAGAGAAGVGLGLGRRHEDGHAAWALEAKHVRVVRDGQDLALVLKCVDKRL